VCPPRRPWGIHLAWSHSTPSNNLGHDHHHLYTSLVLPPPLQSFGTPLASAGTPLTISCLMQSHLDKMWVPLLFFPWARGSAVFWPPSNSAQTLPWTHLSDLYIIWGWACMLCSPHGSPHCALKMMSSWVYDLGHWKGCHCCRFPLILISSHHLHWCLNFSFFYCRLLFFALLCYWRPHEIIYCYPSRSQEHQAN
jgi:hypothetical protein